MKYIKLFENHDYLDELKDLCYDYSIEYHKVKINDDNSIDVDDNVNISNRGLKRIPIKFRNVHGYFACNNNKLETLENSPIYVNGTFNCQDNFLKTLDFFPKKVNGSINISQNEIESLKGLPDMISGNFLCNNNITSLKYAPTNVTGRYSLNIESLPIHLRNYLRANADRLKYFLKLQDEYKVWNNDESLNYLRFKLLREEIENILGE